MRKNQAGFTVVELLAVFVGFGGMILGGTAIYVVGHFIAKFW